MTYGEAVIKAREDVKLSRDFFVLELPTHKDKMSYKELCKYYNDKLFMYWLSKLRDDIPHKMKRKVLMYLLGRL